MQHLYTLTEAWENVGVDALSGWKDKPHTLLDENDYEKNYYV